MSLIISFFEYQKKPFKIIVMKKFRILFSDPKGVLDPLEFEIYASSFPDAYVKACGYQELSEGLFLQLIELLDFM